MGRPNVENLIPFSERSEEEVREMNRRGGIASGASRRYKRTFREALKKALGCEIPRNSPIYTKLKTQMKALGIDGEPTVQDIPVLGMIQKASKDSMAFAVIRDTIGEKPVEQYEDIAPESPIILGAIPAEMVEAAKAAKAARQLEGNKR